ncbi:MAG: BrnT family toxin [Selenomonadaceae bacterium]|nr:BrnT family toxin [Selenomonadaceae bacterium]
MILLQTEIGGRRVEWDDNKAAINFVKHGLKFATAAKVFLDENRYTEIDYEHSEEELRYKTIGMVDNVLTVIHTEHGESTRLISARKATKKERMIYYGQHFYLSGYED